ncbi:hypothetical protein J7T55_014451 [Diaporthe amygdali]|nr:uncharacterized protein J7T55_014451 [Diaporthe amygdali]KAJ0118000.1 hypothetical protein J7T55_014451 [Diaporthe amygdali]
MDHARNNMHRSATRAFPSRHPRLAIFALTAAGVALGIKYQSDNLARNEKAQRATRDPNYYVSVDRSGGGI